MNGTNERLEAYLNHRHRLVRLAYRYLGSVSEAEDAVQDAWLRFADGPAPRDVERYLSRIVTNLCLDRLKSARARRESYVGPWLPEPLVEKAGSVEPIAEDAALDISFGVMRALERLSPLERAALFLHDLFDLSFDEIGETLHRTPAACRKLAERARHAIRTSNRRFRPSEADVGRFVTSFQEAVLTGNLDNLKKLLAEDVELVTDGGGKVSAALNVVIGADKVARLLLGLANKNLSRQVAASPAIINDAPGLIVTLDGQLDQTLSIALDGAGRITGIYMVRNPDKLTGIPSPLSGV
ncbi:RNA polymerase sigma factor SigJ [Sinorhizobium fredii]|uniref:RNA polymerase sigma factor SigJ n=1 Tax=Rhizobium fredii TaxID=380 RepID=UPI003519AC03